MQTRIACLFALIFCVSASAQAPNRYHAAYSAVNPKMDGEIKADPAWEKAPWSRESFKVFRTNTDAAVSTRFKALYTDDALYLAIECQDPEMRNMKPENNPTEYWLYDSLEMFFYPAKEELIHLLLSAGGMANQKIPGAVSKRTKFRTAWQGMSKKYDDCWTSEVCVPFFLLGKVPSADKDVELAFTVSRYAPLRKQYSTWTQQDNLSSTESYGKLVLEKTPAGKQAKIDEALCTPHWLSLAERWGNIRKDKSWATILDDNRDAAARVEKIYADPANYAGNSFEFAKNLAVIEKCGDQKEAADRANCMRRFFEE